MRCRQRGPIFLNRRVVDQRFRCEGLRLGFHTTGASHCQTVLLFSESHFEQGQLFCSIALASHVHRCWNQIGAAPVGKAILLV